MASEAVKIYHFENGLPHYRVLEFAYKFLEDFEQYPAKVTSNPKYRDMGSTAFIPFPTKPTLAMEPLGLKDIENAPIAQGYHLPIEYDEEVDEHTLRYTGFADFAD